MILRESEKLCHRIGACARVPVAAAGILLVDESAVTEVLGSGDRFGRASLFKVSVIW